MFSKLIGNEDTKALLRRLLAAGRVPNSILFAGAEGIGKKRFALELAKSLLCLAPKNNEACDECSACRRADVFVFPTSDKGEDHERVFLSEHPDVGMVIAFKRNIRVNAIRELEKEAYFRPYEAAARFFIIDDADKLNDASANALLKTLEEPAATSHIILISSRPDSLLQTIRSRCQLIRFAPIETDEMKGYLQSVKSFSAEDAELAARMSTGSLGRALRCDIEKIKSQRESMLLVLQNALVKRDKASLLLSSEKLNEAGSKDNYENVLEILLTLIRDVWTLGIGGSEAKLVNSDIAGRLKPFAESANMNKLSAWITEIEMLRESFAVNINRKVATDALFVRFASS